jgi:site-specific recombinase XerD
MAQFRDRMLEEMELRRFSLNTQEAYVGGMKDYVRFCRRAPDQLTANDVRRYKLHLTRERKLSVATVNQRVAAIRFFYTAVCKVPWSLDEIPYQKGKHTLPVVPTRQELRCLLASALDLMARTFLALVYGCGLRLSEARMLRVSDIDSERMRIVIRQGKGRRDRETVLGDRLLKLLRDYYRQYRPKDLLFPGEASDKPLDPTSFQRLFHKARTTARITKPLTVHSLRHAFATHALENGMNVLVLKELLGHRSLRTTLVYLHLAKDYLQTVRSPLDALEDREAAQPPAVS